MLPQWVRGWQRPCVRAQLGGYRWAGCLGSVPTVLRTLMGPQEQRGWQRPCVRAQRGGYRWAGLPCSLHTEKKAEVAGRVGDPRCYRAGRQFGRSSCNKKERKGGSRSRCICG